MVAGLIMGIIPDVPQEVKVQIHRENELEKQILFEDDHETKNIKDTISEDNGGATATGDMPRFRGNNNSISPQ